MLQKTDKRKYYLKCSKFSLLFKSRKYCWLSFSLSVIYVSNLLNCGERTAVAFGIKLSWPKTNLFYKQKELLFGRTKRGIRGREFLLFTRVADHSGRFALFCLFTHKWLKLWKIEVSLCKHNAFKVFILTAMHAPMKDLVLTSVVAYVKCIDYLIGKVSKRVAMLSRMRKNIMYTAGTVYKPFVLPSYYWLLRYCVQLPREC